MYGIHYKGSRMYWIHCIGSRMYGIHCIESRMYWIHCIGSRMYGIHCKGSRMYWIHCKGFRMYWIHCKGSRMYRIQDVWNGSTMDPLYPAAPKLPFISHAKVPRLINIKLIFIFEISPGGKSLVDIPTIPTCPISSTYSGRIYSIKGYICRCGHLCDI